MILVQALCLVGSLSRPSYIQQVNKAIGYSSQPFMSSIERGEQQCTDWHGEYVVQLDTEGAKAAHSFLSWSSFYLFISAFDDCMILVSQLCFSIQTRTSLPSVATCGINGRRGGRREGGRAAGVVFVGCALPQLRKARAAAHIQSRRDG